MPKLWKENYKIKRSFYHPPPFAHLKTEKFSLFISETVTEESGNRPSSDKFTFPQVFPPLKLETAFPCTVISLKRWALVGFPMAMAGSVWWSKLLIHGQERGSGQGLIIPFRGTCHKTPLPKGSQHHPIGHPGKQALTHRPLGEFQHANYSI